MVETSTFAKATADTLSPRATKLLLLIPPFAKGGSGGIFPMRQQTLADQLVCSRRTVGRALKELKEAGLLVDLNRRHANRCKMYQVNIDPLPNPLPEGEVKATAQGAHQLKLFRFTFEVNLRDWPDWEKYYPQVTQELAHVTDPNLLFRQTFDKLYAIREFYGIY